MRPILLAACLALVACGDWPDLPRRGGFDNAPYPELLPYEALKAPGSAAPPGGPGVARPSAGGPVLTEEERARLLAALARREG
jgi:hypothetical protein